jgi:Spy/CpxP family protein refolding chaperone
MRRFLSGILIGCGILICAAAQVRAESDLDGHHKMRERLELLTMWKMMEVLDLDKPTREKLFEIRQKFLNERKSVQKTLHEDFRKLKQRLSENPPDDDRMLADTLRDIRESRKKLQHLREEQYEEVSGMLTVKQRAKLVLFLKEFQKEMSGLIPPPHPGQQIPGEKTPSQLPPHKGQ